MKSKEIHKYNRLSLVNRWKQKRYSRNCDWVIIGVSKWWHSVNDYCYKISFFGIDLQIWFKRCFKQD